MCAPTVTTAMKGRPAPWMSDDVREAVEDRNGLQRELNSDTNNLLLRESYEIAEKHVKTLINRLKAEQYLDRLRNYKRDISVMCKIIEEIIPNQNNKHNTYAFHNVNDKAENFNSFFSSIGKFIFTRSQEKLENEGESVIDRPLFNTNINSAFGSEPADDSTVKLTVKELNATTSMGSNGIVLLFLRDALCVIIPFLTCVDMSVVTGVFPEPWKHALVVPLY